MQRLRKARAAGATIELWTQSHEFARRAGAALAAKGNGPPISEPAAVAVAAAAVVLPLLAGWLACRAAPPRRRHAPRRAPQSDRLIRAGTAALAVAVVTDATLEHYRGDYANRLMYAAPVAGAALLTVAVAGRGLRRSRTAVFAGAGAVGAIGLAFHVWNILKRPGGLSWNNLFYAAPPAAPGTLIMAGACGLLLLEIEHPDFPRSHDERRRIGMRSSLLAGGGLLGTVAEVAILHFRGAFHDPFMYLPIVLPPAATLSLGWAMARAGGRAPAIARGFLQATTATGIVGTGFHAYGVSRNMGGWRNWTQNALAGPPTPAPIGFTGIALAGLAGLHLMTADHG